MWVIILMAIFDLYYGFKKLERKDDTCVLNFTTTVLLIAVMVVLQRL